MGRRSVVLRPPARPLLRGLVTLTAALLLLLGAPRRTAADAAAPVSCDAKIDSLLASPDFLDFAGEVRSANVERVALLQALMEDPEVEVVVEEQFSESSVFDFNEDLDDVRAMCTVLDFNQSAAEDQGTSLCLSVVSVSPVNTTFAAIQLTVPVCRPTGCSPEQVMEDLSCESVKAYLFLPASVQLGCEAEAVFCEVCSGCFIDSLAEILNISPDYVVVVLVVVLLSIVIAVLVGVARSRRCSERCGRAAAAGDGSRSIAMRSWRGSKRSVSEQYYAQFEESLQQRRSHLGDGARPVTVLSVSQEADAVMWKKRITAIYLKHRPTKMDELPSVLARYRGQEKELFSVLSRKYDEV